MGKNNPKHNYQLAGGSLPVVEQEKDLGVHVNSTLKWDQHIMKCIGKAKQCIAWISRSVICRVPSVMLNIYKTLIRPHLEYCVQLWSPASRHGNWGLILAIEGVQRQYTRMIDGVGLLSYQNRLDKLNLTTLLERRARGDLIETYKIVSGLAKLWVKVFHCLS